MAGSFDAYHEWLAIAPRDQPPNHYRLLGVDLFEPNANVIDGAADRQMAHLRTFQTGQRSKLCQRMLNEVSAARVLLLDERTRAAYDAELRQSPGIKRIEPRMPAFQAAPASPTPTPAASVVQAMPIAAVAAPAPTTPQIVSGPAAAPHRHRRRKQNTPLLAIVAGVAVLGVLGILAVVAWLWGDREARLRYQVDIHDKSCIPTTARIGSGTKS